MVILVGCQSRATNGAHTRNHAPSLSTLVWTVSLYRAVSSLEKTCQEFPIHSESIFVRRDRPSLNGGGGLRYQFTAACNAVLGFPLQKDAQHHMTTPLIMRVTTDDH